MILTEQRPQINNIGNVNTLPGFKLPSTVGHWPEADRAAVILVEGLNDQEGTLEANIHFSVAHELFHIIIKKHSQAPWNSAEHLPNVDSVMGEPGPGPVPPDGRLTIQFDANGIERSAVNLTD